MSVGFNLTIYDFTYMFLHVLLHMHTHTHIYMYIYMLIANQNNVKYNMLIKLIKIIHDIWGIYPSSDASKWQLKDGFYPICCE